MRSQAGHPGGRVEDMKLQIIMITQIIISFSNLPGCFVSHKGANSLRKLALDSKVLAVIKKNLNFGRRIKGMIKQTNMNMIIT